MFIRFIKASTSLAVLAFVVPTNANAESTTLCDALGVSKHECGNEALSDKEMGELRGGFGGIAFSILFGGSIANSGGANTLPDGVGVSFSDDNHVQLSGALGSFAGANGIFQLANIEGNNNIINNTLTINIAIINGTAPDAVSSLMAALGGN